MDVAFPRSLGTNRSAIVPPPTEAGTEAANPTKNRNPISELREGATAQATANITKSTFVMWYTGARPYISDNGDKTSGPIPYPRTQIETTKTASS